MLKRDVLACGDAEASDLTRHVGTFVESLVAGGYVETTRQAKRRILESFVRWALRVALAIASIDEDCIDGYLKRAVRRPHRRGRMDRCTLLQFLEYLRHIGAARPSAAPHPSRLEVLLGHYVDHLRHARGLSDRSIAIYSPIVRGFLLTPRIRDARALDAALDAAMLREYVLDHAQARSFEVTRLMTVALRSFGRFLFLHGHTSLDLSTAVPGVRRRRCAAVPPLLSAAEVEQVLAAIDRTTSRGRRSHAILLLLARLGLRPGEVARLKLDDVRWAEGELVVHGKGGSHDRLPLPEDAGAALASYLREDRGRSSSRNLFLRLRAPRVELSGPCAVSAVARDALRRAGLHADRRAGAHLFRHSLATRMIRNGASMAEISQVLRHRCAATTRTYAKVDFTALRAVARPWPVTGGAR